MIRRTLTLTGLYLATALAAAFVTVRVAARGASVEVPPLAGKDLRQVRQVLAARGLELAVTGENWSETMNAGCVLGQEPAAGARVKRGRRVRLTVSRGSELVKIPALRETRLDDSEFLLRQLGLALGGLTFVPSSAPKRQILAQTPLPGTVVPRGQTVQLLVSDGPQPAAFAVPAVVGLPTREALARLKQTGLRVAEIAYESATVHAEAVVLAQDPPGGVRILAGEEVRLRASRSGETTGLARYVTFSFLVPLGPARRVRAVVVDEAGSREVGNDVEDGGRTLRYSTRVQGEAVAQFFVGGTLVEERPL